MESRRLLPFLTVTAILLAVCPLLASRAGAGLVSVPGTLTGPAVGAPTRGDRTGSASGAEGPVGDAGAPLRSAQRERPIRNKDQKRAVQENVSTSPRKNSRTSPQKNSRTSPRKNPGTRAQPKTPPTMCEAVVATIAWPRGWRTVCGAEREGLLGLTNPKGVSTFYVRADESLSTMHIVALHEAGHAWD